MRQKTYWHRTVWRLAVALALAALPCLATPLPAAAQNLSGYFQLGYDPVIFSKNEIQGSEDFTATITGRATCAEDLPMSIGEAFVTSSIEAEHAVSGASVTLNSSYTITIKPFPSKKGETAEISQDVPLKFPAQAQSGDYNIIGKIVEAEVKTIIGWIDVTGYLPPDQLMGSIKYTAPEPTSTPAPAQSSTPAPSSTPALSSTPTPAPTPPPVPSPAPAPSPASTESGIPWWVWPIVFVAIATVVVNITWFLRHRTR